MTRSENRWLRTKDVSGDAYDARYDERRQNEVGRIRHRRQCVRGEHGEPGDARQTLVMRERGRNGLAEQETLEGERGVFRHPRTPMDASKERFRVTPTGLADGLGLGLSLGAACQYAPTTRVPRILRVTQDLSRADVIIPGFT